jgi:hypothetical protein
MSNSLQSCLKSKSARATLHHRPVVHFPVMEAVDAEASGLPNWARVDSPAANASVSYEPLTVDTLLHCTAIARKLDATVTET